MTGYLLSLAAVIPVAGWAARRFGRQARLPRLAASSSRPARRSAAWPARPTELIVFRVLQGVGGGLILPVGQLIMACGRRPEADGPRDERDRGAGDAGADPRPGARRPDPRQRELALDLLRQPPDRRRSRSCSAVRGLPSPRARSRPAGSTSSAWCCWRPACPAITYGLAEVGATGGFSLAQVIVPLARRASAWSSPSSSTRCASSARCSTCASTRARTFASASLTTFCLGAALFGAMILMPLYYQQVRHESVLDTGLLVGPQGLGAALRDAACRAARPTASAAARSR